MIGPMDSWAAFRELPLADIATADARLIIWINNFFLGEALALAAAWGWSYDTSIAVVPRDVRGIPTREHHSHLLIMVRGDAAPSVKRASSVLYVDEHPETMKAFVAKFVVDILDAAKSVVQTYGEPAHPDWTTLADILSGTAAQPLGKTGDVIAVSHGGPARDEAGQ